MTFYAFLLDTCNPHDITDVSIDMSPAFINGVEENLPHAAITFDKYHIMKIINTAVDDVHKAEVKEQILLWGQKYIFLKNRQNLTEAQRKSLKAIEAVPRLNLKTLRAYHIRENFQEIYKEETREGLNSLVQATKAKARGYRTFKNLNTIICMLTGKLDYTKVGLPT